MRLIGAHVSASGGIEKAVDRAEKIGCNALQLFTGSPRVWKSKSSDEFDYDAFLANRKAKGITSAVIHATYLVNLASDKPELLEKSRKALVNDLNVCSRGDFEGVVVHVGSHQGRGFEAMKDQMCREISEIIKTSEPKGVFLIENSAGQKGKIASKLEEIRILLDGVDSDRLGWCLDTCHAHAAGYDFEKLVEEIEQFNLWSSLRCIHVNDSRDAFDSGRDRHENLGEGALDLSVLKKFLALEELQSIPLILEVPGFDGKGPDQKNVDILKKII